MGTGSFLFLISDFLAAIGRCCFQPRILVPNFIIVSPNSKLGAQFPVWGLSFAFGDNIRQVGTTFCILWPQIPNWASDFPFGD